MDYRDIEKLLDKYWACETSLEEEDLLKDFFQQDDIPGHLLPYASMFRYYSDLRIKSTSEEFDQNLLEKIKKKEKALLKHRYLPTLYKVAAAVLLVLSFMLIHERYTQVRKEAVSYAKDTFKDPQAALDQTKRILLMVSEKMNKGTEQLARVNEFNKVEMLLDNSKTQ